MHPQTPQPSPSVLVVEDNDLVRRVLLRAMSGARLASYETDCGEEAIEMAKSRDFSVVVTDLNLPDYQGTELVELIGDHCPDTLFIIFTGDSSFELPELRHRDRVAHVLPKPIEPTALAGIVASLFDDSLPLAG